MRLVTMKPTSVIIMDTHPIIRMSIEVLLQKNSELQIVLKTDDYRITIDYLRTRPVDLIIMDIDLPGTDGFTFLKKDQTNPEHSESVIFIIEIRMLLCWQSDTSWC